MERYGATELKETCLEFENRMLKLTKAKKC